MKRLFLALCLMTMPVMANAWQVIGSGGGGVVDYCADKLGSYSLYYDVDYPSSTITACPNTVTVTLASVTADAFANSTAGGVYGILWDGACNKYANIPVPAECTTDNCRIEFTITTPATLPASDTMLFEWVTGTGSRIWALWDYVSGTSYRVNFTHDDGATLNATSNINTSIAPSTEYTVSIDYSGTAGNINVGLTGTTTKSTAGTISSFTRPTNGARFGEDTINQCFSGQPLGFDDLKFGASQQ